MFLQKFSREYCSNARQGWVTDERWLAGWLAEIQTIWTGRWNQAVMLSLWEAVTVPLCLQYQIGVVLVRAGQTSAQSIMSVCWPQQSCDLVMWHVWYISVWVTGAAQCMVCIVIGAGRHWPQYIPLTLNLLFLKRNLMPLKTSLGYTRPFRYSFMLYGDIFGEFLVALIWTRCVYCTMRCVIDWGLQRVNLSLVQEGQKLCHHLGYWSLCLTWRSWLCVCIKHTDPADLNQEIYNWLGTYHSCLTLPA